MSERKKYHSAESWLPGDECNKSELPTESSLAASGGSDSPELTLTQAGWVRRGKLWISPYTGSVQSLPTAHCIEQMEAFDRESPNS